MVEIQQNKLERIEKINGYQLGSFIFLLANSSLLGINTFLTYQTAKIEAYLACLIGSVIGFVFFAIFLYLRKHSKEKNIILVTQSLFGKIMGTIINVLINSIVLLFVSISLYQITSFIITQYLSETPSIYISGLIMITVVYVVRKGIVVMSKSNQIFAFVRFILFSIAALSLLQYGESNNLLPFLEEGIKNPIIGGLVYAVYMISPIFLLTIVDKDKMQEEKGFEKKLIIGYLISNITTFCVFLITILTFGIDMISIVRYPEYIILKKVKLFASIERIENILALLFVLDNLALLSLGIYFFTHSVKMYARKWNTTAIIVSCAIGLVLVANYVWVQPNQVEYFVKQYLTYILGIGFLGIMTVIFFGVLLKNRQEKIQQSLKEQIKKEMTQTDP